MWHGRLILGAGLRFDDFRYGVEDELNPEAGGVERAGRWQGKGSAAYTPLQSLPLTFHCQLRPGHQQHRCPRRGAASGSAAAGAPPIFTRPARRLTMGASELAPTLS